MSVAIVLVALIYVGGAVVCWLKGKRLWAIVGFFSMWHLVPAIRLAKPESWWAQRFYDEDKVIEARDRFVEDEVIDTEVAHATDAEDAAVLAAFDADEICHEDKITRKAWEKAQRRRGR